MPSYIDQLRADIQPSYTDTLYHHGVKGQHWGVRRYRNEDGSVTSAGAKHVQMINDRAQQKGQLKADLRAAKTGYKSARAKTNQRDIERADKVDRKWDADNIKTKEALKSGKISKQQAKEQYAANWDKAMGRYKKVSDQYVKETTRNKSSYHEKRAKAFEKASKATSDDKFSNRRTNDKLRGKAVYSQAKANLVKAKASGDKSAARAARKTMATSWLVGDTVQGAYKRYRDNGASRAKAMAKASLGGAAFRR